MYNINIRHLYYQLYLNNRQNNIMHHIEQPSMISPRTFRIYQGNNFYIL